MGCVGGSADTGAAAKGGVQSARGTSELWRRDPPWAAIYAYFVRNERLGRVLGRLFMQTDATKLYDAAMIIGEMPDGSAILDIPCGGGVALRGLRSEQKVRYVAADIGEAMLERTRRIAEQRGLDQVEYRQADVEQLPFADGEFDLVVSFTGLHCFPDPHAAVKEIVRCIAPGGRLSGSSMVKRGEWMYAFTQIPGRMMGLLGPGQTADELRTWFEEAGLEDIVFELSGPAAYFTARRAAAA